MPKFYILPKFFYQKLSKMKMKSKINLIILALIIPIFFQMFFSMGNFILQIREDIERRFSISEDSVKKAVDFHKGQTFIVARMIAANPWIQDGISFKDTNGQKKLAEKLHFLTQSARIEYSWLYNLNGNIVARGHDPANITSEDDPENQLFKKALEGDSVYTIEYTEDHLLFFKVAVPVYSENKKSILGVCVTGFKNGKDLTPVFASIIRDISGVEILLAAEDQLITTSFGTSLNNRNVIFEGNPDSQRINGIDYDLKWIKIWDTRYIPQLKIAIAIDNSQIKATMRNTVLVFLSVFLLATFISYVISRKVSGNIVHSTSKIMEGTERISKRDFSYQIKLSGQDELSILAHTFNNMTSEIKEYSEHLEDLVSKRTQELNAANQELKKINAEMLKELKMAQRVQLSLIPKDNDFPETTQLVFGSNYTSMESIGGDIYDVFPIDSNNYGLLMADVSGHGVPAALITTMAKVSFTNNSKRSLMPHEVCTHVNKEIFKFIGDLDYYLTAYYAVFNLKTAEFYYTNAGHHPAILYRKATKKIEKLDSVGFFIGSIDDARFETGSVKLEKGDRVLLFTDGIIEARNPQGEFYEYERLLSYVNQNSEKSPKDFVDGLMKDLSNFCEDRAADDDRAVLYFEFIKPLEQSEEIRKSIKIETAEIKKSDSKLEEIPDFKRLYQQGMNHLKNMDYIEALHIFEKLREINTKDSRISNNIGVIYYKMGNFKKAFEIIEEALETNPENENLKKNKIIIQKELEKQK